MSSAYINEFCMCISFGNRLGIVTTGLIFLFQSKSLVSTKMKFKDVSYCIKAVVLYRPASQHYTLLINEKTRRYISSSHIINYKFNRSSDLFCSEVMKPCSILSRFQCIKYYKRPTCVLLIFTQNLLLIIFLNA